ncbi:MAG: YiaA/YiaB family inner membrane protein [Acetobacteraceae bacterium]
MNNNDSVHAPAWVLFTYVSFIASLVMVGGGIIMLPIDLWMRAFLVMGMLMLVQSLHHDDQDPARRA